MGKRNAYAGTAAVIFLALGVILRLWYYLDARSLFIDEANLALNVSELSYGRFFQPLLYDQYAPPLFLVLSKWAVALLGNHEWALRLLPLAGGVFSLFVIYLLSRKMELAPAIRWYPLALLALSPFMLRFSTEFKQYSTDAALTLGLLWFALRLPPERMKARHFWLWGIAGALSVWLSMPAVFILAGVGSYYLHGFIRAGNGKAVFRLSLAGLAWLLSFTLFYFRVLKTGIERPVLQDYHAAYFFPLRLWEPEAWKQMGSIFYGLLSPVLGFTIIGLASGTGLLIWGAYHMYHKERGRSLLFSIPILACFSASAFQFFSLIPRVSLFLMPLFLFLAAYGASELWKNAGRYARLGLLALLILEAAPFFSSVKHLGKSTEVENTAALFLEINERGLPGPAYIDAPAVPAFRYYSRWHEQKAEHRLPAPVFLSWDSDLKEKLEGRPAGQGFWLVFSNLHSEEAQRRKEQLRNVAKAKSKEVLQLKKKGAAAYWYEGSHHW